MNMCPIPLGTNSMQTQVGQLVFLKSSISKERSNLKISSLKLLAHSVRLNGFHTNFTISKNATSVIHDQPHVLFQLRMEKVLFFATGGSYSSVVGCVKRVPIPVIKQDNPLSFQGF